MASDKTCPLCGKPFRTILRGHEWRAYAGSNPSWASCLLYSDKDRAFHTIHTNESDEWVTPPESVMERTIAFVDDDVDLSFGSQGGEDG